jgi:hypothetical protein
MLKKLFVTAAAAAAVSVPLAGVAWADPPSGPGSSSNAGTPNGNGIGQGGVPQKAGAFLDSVSADPANSGLPNLNPNGSGPVAPGTVYSNIAKLPGSTPDATAGFVNQVYGAYATPEAGGVPVVTSFEVAPPGMATKTFTPGCSSGHTATDPAVNGGNSVCR